MRYLSVNLIKRLVIHGAFGALAGYILLHPLSMFAHAACYAHGGETGISFLKNAFSRDFSPLQIYFTILGTLFGLAQGFYSYRVSKLFEQVKLLSVTDELTGLYNRRYFMSEFNREVERASRNSRSISILMIDIDHFIEYVIHFGLRSFNLIDIYQACEKMADSEEEGGVKRLYLIFHAIEIAALLWLVFAVFKNVLVFAAALGYSVHLFMDLKFNHQIKPTAYFLLWRMKHGFSTASLLK